jgi:hypothetical protein
LVTSIKPELSSEEESAKIVTPSCHAAVVVYRHAVSDLAEVGKVDAFKQLAAETFGALEMAILGFSSPQEMDTLRDTVGC